ncbi:NACHT domain-containing protein [Micromonospora sp. CPCC 205558]|uniref:NACHT domain-containing protein n=1 Tax=Micromonospora sp. CPCC 205558 TaxID=3122403 RepID=UPI002FF3EF13
MALQWLRMVWGWLDEVDLALGVLLGIVVVSGWVRIRMHRLRRGAPEERYRRWFITEHRVYNPYLAAPETLRLERTLVPLFVTEDGQPDRAADAGERIADRDSHVVLLGDAGSGKTTTLKAFGIAALGGIDNRGGDGRNREVPFLVPVRLLRGVVHPGTLTDYILAMLRSQKGLALTKEEAQQLLAQVLQQRRCVVLLDGLDEVTPTMYSAVRDEVYRFLNDHTPELPTANARIVITCRRLTFLRIADDWRPERLGAHRSYVLAPLRDTEILAYLRAFPDRFPEVDGPQRFMQQLRASGTLGMHRNPLVLSMSVGLYAGRKFPAIAHSTARLYDEMIDEMLGRHSFRADDLSSGANEFDQADKLRVLREFALRAALGPPGFGPFDRLALVDFVSATGYRLRQNLNGRAGDFVDEIIHRSGLLSRVADEQYEFVHRSLQEHLVAAELLRQRDDGLRLLRERAMEREWRRVVLFYTAVADQAVVTGFIEDLGDVDPALACACLAGADCLNPVGFSVLERMAEPLRDPRPAVMLPALAAVLNATASPRAAIRDAARDLAFTWLTKVAGEADAADALGGTHETLLDVVTMLVERLGESAVSRLMVARLVGVVPDDPRFVEPLWRCLRTAEGAGTDDPSLVPLVDRLLRLATDPACFHTLQRQPAAHPRFATAPLRQQVYPFRRGLDRESNLVTLLCWAREVAAEAADVNRFLEAKATDPGRWASLEADWRHRAASVVVPAFRAHRVDRHPAERATGAALTLLSVAALVAVGWDLARPGGLLGPFGGTAAVLLATVELGLALTMLGLQPRIRMRGVRMWRPNEWIDAYEDPRSRHWLVPDVGEGRPVGGVTA